MLKVPGGLDCAGCGSGWQHSLPQELMHGLWQSVLLVVCGNDNRKGFGGLVEDRWGDYLRRRASAGEGASDAPSHPGPPLLTGSVLNGFSRVIFIGLWKSLSSALHSLRPCRATHEARNTCVVRKMGPASRGYCCHNIRTRATATSANIAAGCDLAAPSTWRMVLQLWV
jgi:hypothetical protein